VEVYQFFGLYEARKGVLIMLMGKIDLSQEIVILP
jgi:hypothetical protein